MGKQETDHSGKYKPIKGLGLYPMRIRKPLKFFKRMIRTDFGLLKTRSGHVKWEVFRTVGKLLR